MKRWLREQWWRLRGRCPSCGNALDFGVTMMAWPGRICSRCGWKMVWVVGNPVESWPAAPRSGGDGA